MREVGLLKKDPDTLKEQIDKLEMMSKSCSIWIEDLPFENCEIDVLTFQKKPSFTYNMIITKQANGLH